MSEPQFDDEIGRLYHSLTEWHGGLKVGNGDMSEQLTITLKQPSADLIVGDTFTIAGVYRLAWWKRVLIRLRLMKLPDPPPPLRTFTIVHVV